MVTLDLRKTARALVATGKGILAADETVPTVTRRLEAVSVPSTPFSRLAYREMFFTTPGVAEFISGVILHDETIRQKSSKGTPITDLLMQHDLLPGIKVDTGTQPLACSPGEYITEGLDGLRGRLKEYRGMGARFAKWRAVINISETLPTPACVHANAHALARYATLCQEQGMVPIVEPEVLMDGSHTLKRCEEVTGTVLRAVFDELANQKVMLEGMLLKPNMVVPGKNCVTPASVDEVAAATVRCLGRHVPAAVPGIVFLSGGQDHLTATLHLSVINQLDRPKPWKLSFSFGRALQHEALRVWRGQDENLKAAQRAFYNRARCDSAAARSLYNTSMEREPAIA
jgi:fructose-bisphosphate aldolase class I